MHDVAEQVEVPRCSTWHTALKRMDEAIVEIVSTRANTVTEKEAHAQHKTCHSVFRCVKVVGEMPDSAQHIPVKDI